MSAHRPRPLAENRARLRAATAYVWDLDRLTENEVRERLKVAPVESFDFLDGTRVCVSAEMARGELRLHASCSLVLHGVAWELIVASAICRCCSCSKKAFFDHCIQKASELTGLDVKAWQLLGIAEPDGIPHFIAPWNGEFDERRG